MSADNLHRQIEEALRQRPKVYDFTDFSGVVKKCNRGKMHCKEMNLADFRKWPDLASLYQMKKIRTGNGDANRPLLRDISVIIARRGFTNLFYKTDFESEEKELHFIAKKFLKPGSISAPTSSTTFRGIGQKRKDSILKNLSHLMPQHKLQFWLNLPVNDNSENDQEQITDD